MGERGERGGGRGGRTDGRTKVGTEEKEQRQILLWERLPSLEIKLMCVWGGDKALLCLYAPHRPNSACRSQRCAARAHEFELAAKHLRVRSSTGRLSWLGPAFLHDLTGP